jgi:hypothetical protein
VCSRFLFVGYCSSRGEEGKGRRRERERERG